MKRRRGKLGQPPTETANALRDFERVGVKAAAAADNVRYRRCDAALTILLSAATSLGRARTLAPAKRQTAEESRADFNAARELADARSTFDRVCVRGR